MKWELDRYVASSVLGALLVSNAGCTSVLGLDNEYRDGSGGISAAGATENAGRSGTAVPQRGGAGGAVSGRAGDVGTGPSGGGSIVTGGSIAHGGGVASGGSIALGGSVGSGGVATGGSVANGGVATGGNVAAGGTVYRGNSANGGAARAANAAGSAGIAATCAGRTSGGLCWYLGATGASCTGTCANHGGYVTAATTFVGVAAQGGSLQKCQTLLALFGIQAKPMQLTRIFGDGIGCNISGQNPFWLSYPSFDPDSSVANARIVCGCKN